MEEKRRERKEKVEDTEKKPWIAPPTPLQLPGPRPSISNSLVHHHPWDPELFEFFL